MGSITGLDEKPRAPGRYVVLIDSAPIATVSVDVIERLQLSVGRAIDDRVEHALRREGRIVEVYDFGLKLLGFRAKSTKELERRMLAKGFDRDVVGVALDRLGAAGLLDDASYARELTRSKGIAGGMSRRRLQQELARRGVGRDIATEAIARVMTDEAVDEGALAEQAARKKLKSLASVDPQTRRRRLYGYLARRGYDIEDIPRTLSVVLGKEETS